MAALRLHINNDSFGIQKLDRDNLEEVMQIILILRKEESMITVKCCKVTFHIQRQT